MQNKKLYKIAFGAGVLGLFLLGWVSGAVGIIGSENNPANLMYWAVPAVLLIGALISRLHALGMSWTLFAASVVQFLVPIYALFIWPENTSWGAVGVSGVLVFNSIFALIFILSALLFHRVS